MSAYRSLLRHLAVLVAAGIAAAASAQEVPGTLIAIDESEVTSARLIETEDSVLFEIIGPVDIVPGIAIDADRNGKVNSDIDFTVGFAPDGSPCLSQLISEGKSSTCRALGDKAQLSKQRQGKEVLSLFVFPKRVISGDGFGFGFVIDLWNETGNYGTALAAGDYQFGGKLNYVSGGPNFLGRSTTILQPKVLPVIRRYQGCLSRAMRALGPLDRTKLDKLKAVPMGCTGERTAALGQSVETLISSGVRKEVASTAIRNVLDQIDADFARLVQILEKGR